MKSLPWDLMFLFLSANLYAYFSLIPLEFTTYAEVGVQTESLSILTQ
jgi:hypothetical protein